MPQLRLAPPAVYHEKVKKGPDLLTGESSSALAEVEKPDKRRQLRELKLKGSSLRFPLKSSIFGKLCDRSVHVGKILSQRCILTPG
jgi:hypothetical protein